MGDYQDQQEMEIEALESILMDDLKGTEHYLLYFYENITLLL